MENRLKETRVSKGLNQRELSELAHTPQSLVSALERGVLRPWDKVVRRLSDALGVGGEELFPADEFKDTVEYLVQGGCSMDVKTWINM